jgi:6-phosphogluconate dehydrogenase
VSLARGCIIRYPVPSLRVSCPRLHHSLPCPELACLLPGARRQGGCIIRAKVLDLVREAYSRNPELSHLLLDPPIAEIMNARAPGWRRFVLKATAEGLPIPALSASLSYFDSLRSATLPSAQCVQAQRDCFGGHGFKRLDMPGTFHALWRS